MNELLDAVLNFVTSVDPILRTGLAGLAIFLETTLFVGLIVPGDSVVLVASTGITQPWQYWILAITVTICTLAGQSVGFWIGAHFGPRIKQSAIGRKIGATNWQRAENFIDRRGGIAVFVSRFLPILHSLTPVTVGMSNMSYRRFIIWATPAGAIWGFMYSAVGVIAKDAYEALSKKMHGAGYIFVAIIIAFLLVVYLVKLLLSKRMERHMAAPGDSNTETMED